MNNSSLLYWLNKGYYPVNIDKGTIGIFVDTEKRTTYLVVQDSLYLKIEDSENVDEIINDKKNKYLYKFYRWMTGYWNSYSYEDFIDSIIEFRQSKYYEENIEFIKDCLQKDDWKTLNLFIDLAMNDNLGMPVSRIAS